MKNAIISPRTMSGGLITICKEIDNKPYFIFKGIFQKDDEDEYSKTFKALWDDVLAIYPLSNGINYRLVPSDSLNDLQFVVNNKIAKMLPSDILKVHSLTQIYDFKNLVIKDTSLLMMNLAILSELATLGVHINLEGVTEHNIAHNQSILTNTLNTIEDDMLYRYNQKAHRSASQLTDSVFSVITPEEEKAFNNASYLINLITLQRKYLNRK